MAEQPFWRFLYRYGVLAGVFLAACALVLLTLTYWFPRALLEWRRPALFLVLVAAIGPGLLVNVVFKDHYGRPRPREVQELGGEDRFLPVWVKGHDPQAKSFPCGHCSMGFYLSTPYLVLRRRRRAAALAFLVSGIGFGFALGAARMMAGGHFLSDVVWSGGMVWLVALALYRLLRVDRAPELETHPEAREGDRRKARFVTALGAVSLGVLTTAALLATPYLSAKTFTKSSAELASSGSARLEVSLDEANVSLEAGPAFEASYQVRAFGFPTSRLGFAWAESPQASVLSIERFGWFSERRTKVSLRFPADGGRPMRLHLRKGTLTLDLRGFARTAQLDVEVDEGEVRVLGARALVDGGARLKVNRGEVLRE
jgi:membrane-associated PAP2 superfamily phosphatase